VRLQKSFLAGSGIHNHAGDLLIYRRNAFKEQFLFFEEQIVAKGALGWVLGPPGTGKSATAFAYISTLDKNVWTVLWVHFTDFGCASVIIFDGDEKTIFFCPAQELCILLDGMRNQRSIKKTILIIDGYGEEEAWQYSVLGQGVAWRMKDRINRRLAVVTSMSSRGKKHPVDDADNNVVEFNIFSWTLEEYVQATEFDEFLRNVQFSLDSIDAGVSPQEMVEEKFLVAGGCARYMFGMCTSDVKKSINEAIRIMIPTEDILSAFHRSGKPVDLLFNQYQNAWGKTVTTFVSRYAEIEIAILKGPAAVKELFRLVRKFASGSTMGGLFEAIFFLRLRIDAFQLKCLNGTTITFERSEFDDYNEAMKAIPFAGRQLWLRPVSERQIGFDAVFIDKDARFARFVQLARGKSHSFKMEACKVLLDKLQDCKVDVVEFCFVVRDNLLCTFKISGGKKTTGRGCLSDYKVAGKEEKWKRGREGEDAVILGMNDVI
jgi:hypothetical protein